MSDIDKIMKINEMTQNLKKHGFAASSEEAAEQAQNVFKEKVADVEKPESAEKTDDNKSADAKEGGAEEMAGNEDTAKIERNFEVFKSSAQKQIDSMKEELGTVIGKMNEMIRVINELEKLKDSVTSIDEGGSEKQRRLAPKIVKKPKEEKSNNHPRSGDSQPGDVNLAETFYYGNK
jgi:hypothetical protein